jgi:putative Holliday junction resolvase
MSIVLGFDFGMKYIGVAVGQSITKTAKPLTTLRSHAGVPKWDEIHQLVKEWKPTQLIVGIPLNMDGTEQPMTLAARNFGNLLKEKIPLPLHEVDERLSSWEAKNRVFDPNAVKKKLKGKKELIEEVNAVAAAILVEQWLRENLGSDPRKSGV